MAAENDTCCDYQKWSSSSPSWERVWIRRKAKQKIIKCVQASAASDDGDHLKM